MALSIAGLVDRFYSQRWNAWDEQAVDLVLAPVGYEGAAFFAARAGVPAAAWVLGDLTSPQRQWQV